MHFGVVFPVMWGLPFLWKDFPESGVGPAIQHSLHT